MPWLIGEAQSITPLMELGPDCCREVLWRIDHMHKEDIA